MTRLAFVGFVIASSDIPIVSGFHPLIALLVRASLIVYGTDT